MTPLSKTLSILKNKSESWRPLAAVFLLAFITRVSYLIFLKYNYFFFEHPSSDVLY